MILRASCIRIRSLEENKLLKILVVRSTLADQNKTRAIVNIRVLPLPSPEV